MKNTKTGFTLIEVLVVIGILAILAAIVVVAINPARQFAQSRNTQRVANVNAILNAVGQRMVDNLGTFECGGVSIPQGRSNAGRIASDDVDLRSCLVPIYITELPSDPSAEPVTGDTYDTGYVIFTDSELANRIVVAAPNPDPIDEETPVIEASR